MLHEPAASSGPDLSADYKSKLGVLMFIIYGVIYAGFVIINIVVPKAMDKVIFRGLNFAVVYGFGLIVFALILAGIYSRMCTKKEAETSASSSTAATDNNQEN